MWSQQYDHVIQLWTIDASQVVISTLLLIIILAVASIGNSYTLVNIQKVNWKSTCFMIFTNLNQLFLWQFSSSQPVNLLEGIAPGFLSNSSPSGWGSSHKRFLSRGEKKTSHRRRALFHTGKLTGCELENCHRNSWFTKKYADFP